MDKIKILIRNNKEFGDVAVLVDKPEFLEAIDKLRKKWQIKQMLPHKKFKDWQQKLFEQREEKQGEQNVLNNERVDYLSDVEIEGWKEYVERVMPDVDFECDVRDLRIRFKKPDTFDRTIAYAIVCGTVPNGIYTSTYWEIDSGAKAPLRLQDRTTQVAIYVTPQSEPKDVLKALKEVKSKVFIARGDGYDPFFSLYNKDVATNIQRDRKWYWMILREQGNGRGAYSRVLSSWNELCPNPELEPHDNCQHCVEDINIFEQAVNRYKKALKY